MEMNLLDERQFLESYLCSEFSKVERISEYLKSVPHGLALKLKLRYLSTPQLLVTFAQTA
jgi:hypothetical protein